MPRVEIDHVISFSSEDKANPASNLLQKEINKKRWLCATGEPSCSVVLQLEHAVKISSVQIGSYHSAFVEVLVGRSEKPNDQFQVLVPSCVFITPIDSRRNDNTERVRSFSGEQLASNTASQLWDRVRIVCSQPYNKHCKYGLSFIQIYKYEGNENTSSTSAKHAVQVEKNQTVSRSTNFITFSSSDEEEFKPGDLFAKHNSEKQLNTDSQIRQATSNAFKNSSNTYANLVKTNITKNKTRPEKDSITKESDLNRQRDNILYDKDDETPHRKIDNVVERHRKDKEEINERNKKLEQSDKKKSHRHHSKDNREKVDKKTHPKPSTSSSSRSSGEKHHASSSKTNQKENALASSSKNSPEKNLKRSHSNDNDKETCLDVGPVSDSPHTMLRDMVFTLSGYQNPRRGAVRDIALSLGARYVPDWNTSCTHLICAFKNTPKLKTIRSSPNGEACIAVTAEWVEQCFTYRRRLPWQWYATEPRYKKQPRLDKLQKDEEPVQNNEEWDTDDEIEKAISKQKKPRLEDSQSRKKERKSKESIANLCDKPDENDSDCTIEDTELTIRRTENLDHGKLLPDFFEGYTFAIEDKVKSHFDKALLCRYIKTYGGVITEIDEEESPANYLLCMKPSKANKTKTTKAVRPDWIWLCHQNQRLVDVGDH